MPAALRTYSSGALDQCDGVEAMSPQIATRSSHDECEEVTTAQRILMATEPLLAATRRGRGRAEAFARSLHSKLRSLSGSDATETADGADYGEDEGGGGDTDLETDSSSATCQVRLCSASSGDEVFFDMDLSPQSPEEEVPTSELEVFMVNSLNINDTEDDHNDTEDDPDDDYVPQNADAAARMGTSPQSDCSSDYYDPESFEDARTDPPEEVLVKVITCNGTSDTVNLIGFVSCSDPTKQTETATKTPAAEAPQPERRHPWNRVNHRHKAGTPEALRELQNLPPEEDSDVEDRPVISPSSRKCAALGKFKFDKSEETKLQEQVIEQIRQGRNLPEEYKNGLCPGPIASAAAAAKVEVEEIEEALEESNKEEDESGGTESSDGNDERPPRVRRCSSLKTGKTPPGTPGRKKIVRFADVLGLDLADVRTFMDEIPRVPSSAYSDLRAAEVSNLADATAALIPQLALSFGAAPGRCLVAAFQQPGGQPDFIDRIRERQVCLENAVVKDPSLLSIGGTVRVRNLDFHKSVHIRYTTDGWRSFADLQASYVPNSCDGFSDKFTFVLYAAHTMAVGQRLELAVRFQCKGQQFWDSNNGANYAFECLPGASVTTAMSMPMPMPCSPDDASWRSFY